MAKIDFAAFDEFGFNYFRPDVTAVDVYEQTFREVQLEEQLGYKYHFIIEHQGHLVGQCQSPAVYLSALAQCTSTIRIGAMIFLLPFYNPMRLAQDTAMLDQLSRGRLDFGAGTGVFRPEFLRWNLSYEDRRDIAKEALEIVEKAWTEESVTYEGKYWQFDEALPLPRPYQKPHPPVWFAGTSQASLEYAAAHNYNMGMFLDPDPECVDVHREWKRLWKEARHKGPMPHSFLTRSVYVAETDEQAMEEAAPYLPLAYWWGEDRIERTRFGTGTEKLPPYRQEIHLGLRSGIDYWMKNGLAHVGSPETVIQRLEKQQKLIGYDTFGARFRFGPIPDEMVMKSIRLFGEKVMPAFA